MTSMNWKTDYDERKKSNYKDRTNVNSKKPSKDPLELMGRRTFYIYNNFSNSFCSHYITKTIIYFQWIEMSHYGSSRPRVFCKKSILENFAKFRPKHTYHSHVYIKKETLAEVFSCEFCEISEIFKSNLFYRTPPLAASVILLLYMLCYSQTCSQKQDFFENIFLSRFWGVILDLL